MTLTAGDRAGLALVALGAAAGLWLLARGGGEAAEARQPPPSFADPAQARLHDLLVADFGAPEAPRAPAGFEPTGLPAAGADGDARLAFGRGVWRTQCLHCHGAAGGADTPTAELLNPRPRDFGRGIVKFTSTAEGAPAVRADLERTVRDGLASTAMSAFGRLPAPAVQAVVDYTLWLLVRGAAWSDARARLAGGAPAEEAWSAARAATAAAGSGAADQIVKHGAPPPETEEARARGAALFLSAGCATCHGADGGGRGPAAWDAAGERWLLTDAWGLPVQPRDLRKGQHRGGARAEDLHLRIHAGVKGTPMPAHGALLSEAQIWDLVAHLRGLAQP